MPPIAPIVRLEDVDVDIDARCVLRGVSLEIRAGRHLGVIGANGSGKSTLLALLAGQRWPAPGRGTRIYDFGDGPERDAVTARQRIALIGHELQDSYVARGWNFRVRDVVLSGISRSDIPKRRRSAAAVDRAEVLLARMQLAQLADRRILELSRGEQRRVLIARALAFDPPLLLLDEPASGLDAASRAALETQLAAAARLTTLVVAAHRSEELPGIVDVRLTLDGGRLRAPAGPEAAAPSASGSATVQPAAAGTAGTSAAATGSPGAAMANAEAARPATLPLIAVRNASLFIDGRRVLDSLDWELREGEHWLITGPNGAGKSSLLRLLHGEIRPAVGGSIRWPGLGDPADVWTLRRRVALVSAELQARYLLPTTVFGAVASGLTASIGLTRRLRPEEQTRIESLLADFGLEALRERPLRSLSYGQRHRTLIARTLAASPRVLLLDEPWEGLDEATSRRVCDRLRRAIDAGTQLVCVSHVGARGLPLNRALVLEKGRPLSGGGSGARP